MSNFQRHLLLLALTCCALVGCQTKGSRPLSHEDTDIIHYTGDTPVWIFIPFGRLTEEARGYPARIALPPRRDWTTNRIEIMVEGEVIVQGVVRLRPGSTVLQAVSCAGGFSDFAFARRGVKVTGSSGLPVRLYLRSRYIPGKRYREVWYDTKADGPCLSPVSDYALQPGDRIFVARAIFEGGH